MTKEELLEKIIETFAIICRAPTSIEDMARKIDATFRVLDGEDERGIWRRLLSNKAKSPQSMLILISELPPAYEESDLLPELKLHIDAYSRCFRRSRINVRVAGGDFHLEPVPLDDHSKKIELFCSDSNNSIRADRDLPKILLELGPCWSAHGSDVDLMMALHDLIRALSTRESNLAGGVGKHEGNRQVLLEQAQSAMGAIMGIRTIAATSIELKDLTEEDRAGGFDPLATLLACKFSNFEVPGLAVDNSIDSFVASIREFLSCLKEYEEEATGIKSSHLLTKMTKLHFSANRIVQFLREATISRPVRSAKASIECLQLPHLTLDTLLTQLYPRKMHKGHAPSLWMKVQS